MLMKTWDLLALIKTYFKFKRKGARSKGGEECRSITQKSWKLLKHPNNLNSDQE
jgi:hypothetical protein